MYSDSEFKYSLSKKAPNRDDQSNRRSLDPDSDYTIDPWDYTSDVSFWWVYFWDLSFFSVQKRKHYRNLNASVFRPLSKLELIKQVNSQRLLISEYFNYIIVMPTESSKIYKLSLKHMEEDQPQLPIELKNLREMGAKHQILIRDLETSVDNTIKQRFSLAYESPLKIGNSLNFNYTSVYDFLRDIWESNKHNLKQIEDYVKKNNSCFKNGLFYFENRPLGSGNEKEYEMMKNALHYILRNENILKLFSDLTESKDNMNQKITEIQRMSDEIIDQIDNDLYETTIKDCCPSFLGIFKRRWP